MNSLAKIIQLACIVTVVLSSSYAIACSCRYGGKFEVYSSSNPIVVRGTILSYGTELRNDDRFFETMTIEISDVVKGTIQHSRIELQGDTGVSCFKYISLNAYPIGSEHLFSLRSTEQLQPLWGCGESSIRIKGSVAEGFDRNERGFYNIDLDELIGRIK